MTKKTSSSIRIAIGILFIFFILLIGLYCYYYNRWKPLWALEEEKETYEVVHHYDDTLRIVMIGDSWVGMRTNSNNNQLQKQLTQITKRPSIVKTKGTGGAKSREIYLQMFENGDNGTRQLFIDGPDYCIIFAGINDAAANLGTKEFCHHYKLILQFLLKNNICPIIIEIPNVNIWKTRQEKPWKDLACDYVKSTMTRCSMYRFSDYREALHKMLIDEQMLDDIIFVSTSKWYKKSDLKQEIFLEDQVHLNKRGYTLMDSCIAVCISDYLNRR